MEKLEINNKLIVEFLQIPKCKRCPDCGGYQFSATVIYAPVDMRYHTSWDWQIPAWANVTEKIKLLAGKSEPIADFYFKILDKYENAVGLNKVNDGFNVLVDAIQFYNTQNPKQ